MSQHALTPSSELRAAGEQLQTAAAQAHLAGYTKTWTHLLAAAAALVLAVVSDGRVTPGEGLQVLLIVATTVVTWWAPGTLWKSAATLLGLAGNAALPFLTDRWSDLPSVNPSLVLVAVLGAVSSMLLPNARAFLPSTTTVVQDIEPVSPGTALQLLIDGAPVSAVVTGPTPAVPAAAASPTTSTEQDGPTVPAVPSHVSDAVQRLTSRYQREPEPTDTATPTRSSPIRSGYTPAGSGATGVLPTQPTSTSEEDPQGPPARGYDFGGS